MERINYAILLNSSQRQGIFVLKHLALIPLLFFLPGTVLASYADEPTSCIVAPAPITSTNSATNKLNEDVSTKTGENEIHISADSISVTDPNTTVFVGNVILIHHGRKIRADKATYNRSSTQLLLSGNVQIETRDGDVFRTSGAKLNATTEVGTLENGDFYFLTNQSRGKASRMVLNGNHSITFDSVHFSTCPAKSESWSIYFKHLTLDRESDDAIGHHAVFRVHKIPVFYTPYLRFPLGNRRKSGLLVPEFGNNDKTGSTFSLPYYLNLAPNYDATITPRWLDTRGLQFANEFRYLGANYSGNVELDYLPADRVTGTNRSFASVHHQYQPVKNLTATLDYQRVSDKNYFSDYLSSSNPDSIPTHLPQSVEVNYYPGSWAIDGRMTDYQVLDPSLTAAEQPYRRVPQISASLNPQYLGNLATSVSMQYGRFEHPNASVESATRVNLNPRLSYAMHRPWGYLVPTVDGYYTGYSDRSIGSDANISTAILSLDAGLNFSRKSPGQSGWQQTLEPRLFYVYSPYINQSGLPVFDTAKPEFSFDNLFHDNRFVGGDRIGDTNQVTLALSSRWLDPDSVDRLQANIGQVLYFQDRQVALPGSTTDTRSHSETVAEVSGILSDHWYARSTWALDTDTGATNQTRQFLQYQPTANRIVSAGYRYVLQDGESIDLSGQWKIDSRWTVFSRLQYALGSGANLDSYAGFRYQSCCWAFQALASRRVDNSGLQVNAVEFRLTLQGLGASDFSNDRLPVSRSIFSDN